MSTHILKEGQALCGIKGPPAAWPKDDTWVSFDDPRHLDEVDCWRCVCLHVGKPIPDEPKSPEHDKVRASNDLPQKLCEFVLEFLPYQYGIHLAETHTHLPTCEDYDGALLCGYRENTMFHTNKNIVDFAAAFVGVNFKAYSAEKDAMLKYIRELNALGDWARTEGRSMLSAASASLI